MFHLITPIFLCHSNFFLKEFFSLKFQHLIKPCHPNISKVRYYIYLIYKRVHCLPKFPYQYHNIKCRHSNDWKEPCRHPRSKQIAKNIFKHRSYKFIHKCNSKQIYMNFYEFSLSCGHWLFLKTIDQSVSTILLYSHHSPRHPFIIIH